MYNDTVSDFLTRLRNATMAGRTSTTVRANKLVSAVAEILKKEGFILKIEKTGQELELTLSSELPFTHIKGLSKPGIRRYVGNNDIPRPKSGYGMVIVSTPKGVLTGQQARKQKVGGELICEVW